MLELLDISMQKVQIKKKTNKSNVLYDWDIKENMRFVLFSSVFWEILSRAHSLITRFPSNI